MKKNRFWSILLLTMLLSMTGTKSLAYDIAVVNEDGVTIYYEWINNNELAVSASGYYNTKYSGDIMIPESVTYEGTAYSVTSIGGWAFNGCSDLTSVTIPNSVTAIGDEAFLISYNTDKSESIRESFTVLSCLVY